MEVAAMTSCPKTLVWVMVGAMVLSLSPPAPAQQPPPASAPAAASPTVFRTEELDQILAPIALHPDALVAQILMASTYPIEVVQAARFVEANPALKGDALNQALQQYPWDDSVKSLVMFPQVLALLNEKLDWMQKLGDAFLAQQQDVMAAVQRLRARAQEAGQLKTTPEQNVIVEPAASPATAPPPPPGAPPSTTTVVTPPSTTIIKIEPSNPEVIYVPSYDPTVVYGAWPPAYPPYYPYPAGYFAAGFFTFAAGAAVGAALWGDCNWGRGDVTINNSRVNNFTNSVNRSGEARNRVEHYNRGAAGGTAGQGRGQWQHNPEHRKGAQYRDASTQQRFNQKGPANAQSRESFRGRAEGAGAGTTRAATTQSAGGQGTRERAGAGQQPSASIGERSGQSSRQSAGAAQQRQSGGGQARQASAFEGAGSSGRDAQSFSSRGNTSRQSFSSSSGAAARSSAASAPRSGGGGSRGGGGGGRR
jgi:hypothetical protein